MCCACGGGSDFRVLTNLDDTVLDLRQEVLVSAQGEQYLLLDVPYSRTYEVLNGENALGLFIEIIISVGDSCTNSKQIVSGNGNNAINGYTHKVLKDETLE